MTTKLQFQKLTTLQKLDNFSLFKMDLSWTDHYLTATKKGHFMMEMRAFRRD